LHKFKKLTVAAYLMVTLLLALALLDLAMMRNISGAGWIGYLTKVTYAASMIIVWIIVSALWNDLKTEKRKNKKLRKGK